MTHFTAYAEIILNTPDNPSIKEITVNYNNKVYYSLFDEFVVNHDETAIKISLIKSGNTIEKEPIKM